MPQLDPTFFASQLFWLTVSFLFLYFVLARSILPNIQDILEYRKNKIAQDIDRAGQMKLEAEDVRKLYEKSLADARNKSQTLLTSTQASIKEAATKREQALDQMIGQKLTESEGNIARIRTAARERMVPVTTELTSLILEKLVQEKPDSKLLSELIAKLDKEPSRP